jgi:hypothetical protein
MPNIALEQYLTDLNADVLLRAGLRPSEDFVEECFLEHVAELLDEHNEVSGVEVLRPPFRAPSVGSIPAARLGGWSLSGDRSSLDVCVTLFFGSAAVHEVGLTETRKQFALLRGFLRRAFEGIHTKMDESSDAFLAAQQIHEARHSLASIRLVFITDGVIRSLDIDEEPVKDFETQYVVWDLDKLSRLRVGLRAEVEVDLVNNYTEFGGSVPCLQKSDPTGEYRTYLAFVPATLLARIYGEHGQRLLEKNVRAFLQSKGKVNRGLQRTLRDEPHRFLAYNNGLCCTAAEVRVKTSDDGVGKLEWIRDFQIVNGGQTTASIFHALKKEKVDVSGVTVQLKLTVLADKGRMAEIVPLISLYANSQNKVNTADFSANGVFHHALEGLSRSVWSPAASGLERGTLWYYERARGSYADDRSRQNTPSQRREWETQNPPERKFTKTDLAKSEHAWLGLPHLVCLGAEKNFLKYAERLERDGEPVVDADFFKRVVARLVLYRAAERSFSAQKLKDFRSQSVAYAVSWLAERSERRIDLTRIWEGQRLPKGLSTALAFACASAHRFISGQPGNPSEAAKREQCWLEFSTSQVGVGGEWESEWSDQPFVDAASNNDSLELTWERVRHQFLNDARTLGELEAASGKDWMKSKRDDPASYYAGIPWQQLIKLKGIGGKRLRGLVEMFAALA